VDFASPSGGAPPTYGYDATDPSSRALVESRAFARLNNSRRLADVDLEAYDAIFVPGGLGPMVDLAADPLTHRALARFFETDRVVGAVCHGPAALLNVRLSGGAHLVEGKKLTAFSDVEEHATTVKDVPFLLESSLRRHGALISTVAAWQAHVVVDGKLVTGQNPASAAGVGRAMVELLGSAAGMP
jgi:putative intracellular protease/amidase